MSAPHLFKYALLYQGVAKSSAGAIGPDVVDTWESWQCAAYLGVGLPTPDEAMPGRDVMAEHVAWLEARAEGVDLEPPAPDVPDQAAQLALMAAVAGGGD